MPKAKSKPKKPRRVVLGTGHPWFERTGGQWLKVQLFKHPGQWLPAVPIDFDDLGNWDRIRLVAEVLK